jgi:hypothetical protein
MNATGDAFPTFEPPEFRPNRSRAERTKKAAARFRTAACLP